MTQSDLQSPALVVVHPIALLATPALGDAVRALLDSGDTLIAGKAYDGFIEVQTPQGQRGFVPAAACTPLAVGTAESMSAINVEQPIALYRNPVPGGQFIAHSPQDATWIIEPDDPLVLLGRDQAFVLVQCIDGRVGYLPASVFEPGENSWLFSRIDPFNFGCFVIGGALFSGNWMVIEGQLWVIEQFLGSLSIYLVSLIVLGIAASLWWLGSPRAAARSFALGMVLSYVIMVLFEP